MFKNYIKVAWRNLLHNKLLSFINIFGLAIGMTFAMLIAMWIWYETSFDSFHENRNRLALVMKHTLFNNEKNTRGGTPLPLYYELKTNYPEVKRATRITWNENHSLVNGLNKFNRNGRYVDADFLYMFSFPLVKGQRATALKDPNSIVLTESLAIALFGKEDPIGKRIRFDNQDDLTVTAVAKDHPHNSTIDFSFLIPYQFQELHYDWVKNNRTNWGNNFLMNMVELKEGVSMEDFSKKIGPLNVQKDKTLKNQTLFLHPMHKWHLYNDYENWVNIGGKIKYIWLFGIIGAFVLLIACINFMNLATARSEKRSKEVGIRKTLGSQRKHLIVQFLCESMLTAFLAFILPVCLIQLILPLLIDVGFEHIHFSFANAWLLAGAFVICIVTGLVAGSYPALYLSSLIPVRVLKGAMKQGRGAGSFRKILVVSQFTISIGLIISTAIVFEQIKYGHERSIGYDPNNLITVGASRDLANNYAALKQDLLNTGYVEAVTKASQPMTALYNSWSEFSWDGKDPHDDIALDVILTEWDFEKAVGLQFKQGRPFSSAYATDSNAVILNEAALKVIGYKDPVGRTMKSGERVLNIVGVVEDVVLINPFKAVTPMVILFNGSRLDNVNNILLRVKQGADLKKTLAAIAPVFDKYNPASPFEYSFTDEEFAKKFTTENQAGKLAGIFAGLAVFISCLGLFGLSMFMAERRTKEIGIRKVLGASIANLWLLLSKEFLWLVLIACLIASPLSFWLMKDWLQQYELRIEMRWWVFGLSGLLAMVVALVTVSTQAIKAAVANPVRSLRSE
jgi:ABC-type antimicrobial peptide transport system permease subunit